MATDAQLLAFKLADRRLAADKDVIADFDVLWAKYAEKINYDLLPPQDHDDAVALLMANQLRLSMPDNVNASGAQTAASASPGSSRSFATLDLPPGYDPDWYKNSAGHRLIAMHQRAGAGLPLFL